MYNLSTVRFARDALISIFFLCRTQPVDKHCQRLYFVDIRVMKTAERE